MSRTPYQYKIENYQYGLSKDRIRHFIPAVLSDEKGPNTSDAYQFLDDEPVMDALAAIGFVPVVAMQQRAKSKEGLLYTKHAITYRHRKYLDTAMWNIPQVHVVNDHRGGNAYVVRAAIFTLICQNGLIVVSDDFAETRIVHRGDAPNRVVEATCKIAENGNRLLSRLDDMKRAILTEKQRLELAEVAYHLRFGDKENSVTRTITPQHMLNARWYRANWGYKKEERSLESTLYGTFQQLQEAGTKGVTAFTKEYKRVSSKQTNSIDSLVDYNVGLWQAAERYLN